MAERWYAIPMSLGCLFLHSFCYAYFRRADGDGRDGVLLARAAIALVNSLMSLGLSFRTSSTRRTATCSWDTLTTSS